MNNIFALFLKLCRKLYGIVTHTNNRVIFPNNNIEEDNNASKLILEALTADKPCMIARYGSFELNTVLTVMSYQSSKHSIIDFIKYKQYEWWWDKRSNLLFRIKNNAGFFPITFPNLVRYKDRMLEDTKELDILADYASGVRYIENLLIGVKRIHLKNLEPYYGECPWTIALEGKKILVIHPLADQIKEQYTQNRDKLFEDIRLLPSFELYTINAVQSLGGESDDFSNWFEALEWMERQMDSIDFDIALIGCGAYGFCLAAHAKRIGKIGFHIGGVLQYMFGIIGSRWENPNYNVSAWNIPSGFYSKRINSNWKRPKVDSIPKNANQIENSCYW